MGLINPDICQTAYSTTPLTGTYLNLANFTFCKIPDVLGAYSVKCLFQIFVNKEARDAFKTPITLFEREYTFTTGDNPDLFEFLYLKLREEYPNSISS